MFTDYPEQTLKSVIAMKDGNMNGIQQSAEDVKKSDKFKVFKKDDKEYLLPLYPLLGGAGVAIGASDEDNDKEVPNFSVDKLHFIPTSWKDVALTKKAMKSFLDWSKDALDKYIPAWKKTNGEIIKVMDAILNDPLPSAEKIAAHQKIEVEVAEKNLRKLVNALKDLYASPAILSMYLDVIKGIQQGVSEINNAMA